MASRGKACQCHGHRRRHRIESKMNLAKTGDPKPSSVKPQFPRLPKLDRDPIPVHPLVQSDRMVQVQVCVRQGLGAGWSRLRGPWFTAMLNRPFSPMVYGSPNHYSSRASQFTLDVSRVRQPINAPMEHIEINLKYPTFNRLACT